jgi:hypothetical protein
MKSYKIEGIEYTLLSPTFGEDLSSMDDNFSMDVSPDGKNVSPKVNSAGVNLGMVVRCLKSWTFRGYDKNKEELIKEGEVLPITEENVSKLPAKHGNFLLARSRELTTLSDKELKNL